MFCTSCGQKLDDEAKFCSNCGTPLKQAGNGEAGQDKAAEKAGTINSSTPSSIVLPDMVEDSIEASEAVISSDGKYLAMYRNHSDAGIDLQILDTESGTTLKSISRKWGQAGTLMSVSSDGNYVVISGKIVNTQTDGETKIENDGYNCSDYCFSGDNKRLAYTYNPMSLENQLKTISVPKGNELLSLPISWNYTAFALSPDGRYLVIGPSVTFSLYDARIGNKICKLGNDDSNSSDSMEVRELKGGGSNPASVAFSYDSTKIVTLSEGGIRIWDVKSHDMLLQLEKSSIEWTTVRFSPDGKAVVAGSDDGTIQIINAETGEVLRQLRSANSRIKWASYTPDGKKLITYADRIVKFWVSE